MTEDRSLDSALGKIFESLVSSTTGCTQQARATTATTEPSAQKLTHASVHAAAKKNLPPLTKASPLPAVTQSTPATGYYSELRHQQWEKKFEQLRLAEAASRSGIIADELDARETELNDADSELRRALRGDRRAKEEEYDKQRIQRMMEDRLASLLYKEMQASRRRIRIEYELGFDDISTYCRACMRVAAQIASVFAASSEAQLKNTRVRTALDRDKEAASRLAQLAQHRTGFEQQEMRDRVAIDSRQRMVFSAFVDAFKLKVRKMNALEGEAIDLHNRHLARVKHIALEIEKTSTSDEAAARDRIAVTERKTFENFHYSVIDSHQRAMQLQLVRQRKDVRDRAEVEDKEHKGREAIIAEFGEWVEDSIEEATKEFRKALLREARAKKQAARASIEDTCAREEAREMFVADNASWQLLMFDFEESLEYDAVTQERFARAELQSQRLAEKAFINGLLRQRHNMVTSSLRVRASVEQECRDAYEDITNKLQEAQDRHSVEWYEMFRRRLIEEEFLVDAGIFAAHGAVLSRSAPHVPAGIRKLRTEKPVSHPDSPYQLHLRKVVVPWFFGAEPVSLLEKGVLRPTNKFGESVEEVVEMNVRCEILNPHDGDALIFDGPAEPEDEEFDVRKARHLGEAGADEGPHKQAIEYLAMTPRQVSTSFASPSAPSTLIHFKYTGNAAALVEGLKFHNVTPFSKLKLMHRQVTITMGELSFPIFVGVMSPLLTTPDVTVTTNIVTPLALFSGPPVKEFRRVRMLMAMASDDQNDENSLTFKLPAGYFNHPKYGIQLNGKATMRLLKQTQHEIEVEFENNLSNNPKALLAAVRVVRREGAMPLEPIEVLMTLTARDETQVIVNQRLDVDSTRSQAPRLRIPALELPCRVSTCNSATSLLDHAPYMGHLPAYPLLARCSVTFPETQDSFCGGLLAFDVTGEDAGYVSLSLQSGSNEDLALNISEGKLWKTNTPDGTREFIGLVVGNHTNGLVIKFDDATFLPTTYIDPLLRSVVFHYHPGGPPKATKDRCYSLGMRLDVRTDLQSQPIEVSFKLPVQPPVIDLNSLSMGYREGTGYKALPTMSVKPPTYAFKPEARVRVELVNGLEADDSDELSVMDSTPDGSKPGVWWVVMGGQRVASWVRYSKTDIMLFCAPPSKEAEFWRRSDIEDPYPQFNFVAADIPASQINFVLRSLVYQSTSSNAEFTQKTLKLTIDDGVSGCTTAFIDVKIESVDDPTDIILSTDTVVYRQFSHQARQGCSLMPGVILEDVDSDNFHGGFISVEYTSGPTEAGDSLYVLSPLQQEEVIMKPQGLCSASALSYLVEFGGAATGDFAQSPSMWGNSPQGPLDLSSSVSVVSHHGLPSPTKVATSTLNLSFDSVSSEATDAMTPAQRFSSMKSIVGSTVPVGYLNLVLDEQPSKCLTVRDGRLFYGGESIGTLTKKLNTTKHTTVLVFNFKSDSRFVSFPAAQYLMRCCGYENLSPKMPLGPRVYTVRLNCTGLKSTAETVVKITVDGRPSPLNIPPYALNSKYEGDKPLPLVKQLTCSLSAPVSGGYLMASIVVPSNPSDHGDTVVVQETDTIKLRDANVMYKGAEHIATLKVCPFLTDDEQSQKLPRVFVAFTKIPHAEALMALVRALAFSNKGHMTQLRSRQIQLECAMSDSREEATTTTCVVDIVRKDAPITLKLKHRAMVFLCGSQEPITLMHGLVVQDTKGKGLGAGHTIEIRISNPSAAPKLVVGGAIQEGLVIHATSNIVCRHGVANVTLHNIREAPTGQTSPKIASTSTQPSHSPRGAVAVPPSGGVKFTDDLGSRATTAGTTTSDINVGPPLASSPRTAGTKLAHGAIFFGKSVTLTLEADVTATQLCQLLQSVAYQTANRSDCGIDKAITVTISKPKNSAAADVIPVAHLDLSVLVVAEALDCSSSPQTVMMPRSLSTLGQLLGGSISFHSDVEDTVIVEATPPLDDTAAAMIEETPALGSNPELNGTTPGFHPSGGGEKEAELDGKSSCVYLFPGVRVQVPEEADGVEVSVTLCNLLEDGDLVELNWGPPPENPLLIEVENVDAADAHGVDAGTSHFTSMGTVMYANASKLGGKSLLGLMKRGTSEVLLIPGSTPAMEGLSSGRNSDLMSNSIKSLDVSRSPRNAAGGRPMALSPRQLAATPTSSSAIFGGGSGFAVDSLALQGFLRGIHARPTDKMRTLSPERWAGKAVEVELSLTCSLGQNRHIISIIL